jgi:hypothetical protein
VSYSPRHLCRREATYRARIRIYDRKLTEPVWQTESDALALGSVFTIDSRTIARDLGRTDFLLYGEAETWSPDSTPETANIIMPVHLHYASTDASMRGHLASFAIYGAPRVIERGELYYENFPSATIGAEGQLSIFIINPFLRPTQASVCLVQESGAWESPAITIRGKSVCEWKSDASGFPGSAQPVGVVVKTNLKTTAFFAHRDPEGRMLGLDHGHPFLSQVLDHRA